MVMEDSEPRFWGRGVGTPSLVNRIWYLNDNNRFNDLESDEYHDDVNDLEMDEYHDDVNDLEMDEYHGDVNDLEMDEYHDDVCRLQSTNKYIFCCVWNHEKEAFWAPSFESN